MSDAIAPIVHSPTVTSDSEARGRLDKLEEFKRDIEKKLYAASAVAAALGLASIGSGIWISSLLKDINELSGKVQMLDSKSKDLEQRLAKWDTEVSTAVLRITSSADLAIDKMTKRTTSLQTELADASEQVRQTHEAALRRVLEQKKVDASRLGGDDLISRLSNGSLHLTVRSLAIRNEQGQVAATLAADDSGDGLLRVNTHQGERRFLLSLSGKKAQANFYNLSGKRVLSLGTFSDSEIGFARFRDPSDSQTLLELRSEPKGGLIWSYSGSGKEIVYLGPDKDSGNGLLNVMGIHGEQKNSHVPK